MDRRDELHKDEWQQIKPQGEGWQWAAQWMISDPDEDRFVVEYRRAKLERVKTPEEQIVVKSETEFNAHVERNGRCVFSCRRKDDAEIYRLGLNRQVPQRDRSLSGLLP